MNDPQRGVKERVNPQAILLARQLDTKQSAATDGLLMFDPVSGKIVVSVGGVWRTVTLDP